MGKKTWVIVLAVIAVIAIVLAIVFFGQKGNQEKLAADLRGQVEAVAKERDTLKADAEKALADAKAEGEKLVADAASRTISFCTE